MNLYLLIVELGGCWLCLYMQIKRTWLFSCNSLHIHVYSLHVCLLVPSLHQQIIDLAVYWKYSIQLCQNLLVYSYVKSRCLIYNNNVQYYQLVSLRTSSEIFLKSLRLYEEMMKDSGMSFMVWTVVSSIGNSRCSSEFWILPTVEGQSYICCLMSPDCWRQHWTCKQVRRVSQEEQRECEQLL